MDFFLQRILALICALGFFHCNALPEAVAADAFVQNQALGRGVNLGNALEAPREGEWGMVIADSFFPTIAEAGFDHVRVPIRWSAHAAAEPPYTIAPQFFARIDQVIERALAHDLRVVINMHHYDELAADPTEHGERFVALWTQIARHYQDYPATLLFEPLNEPHDRLTAARWNPLLAATIATIRQSNPTRTLVVGPVDWYGIYALSQLDLPADDRHLIVTIHDYQPFNFTHQGAEWVDGSNRWLGTDWTGSADQKAALDKDLEYAVRWAEAHNRPLYLGEFGAYSKADMASRVRWTESMARQAEALGMSWAYWEFGAGFGVYDRTRQQWRAELLTALIPQESK